MVIRIIAVIRSKMAKSRQNRNRWSPFWSRFVARIKVIKDRLFVVPDHPVLKEVLKARPKKAG